MRKCWTSQVIALSALYTVLTQSEQVILEEITARSSHEADRGAENPTDDIEVMQHSQFKFDDVTDPAVISAQSLESSHLKAPESLDSSVT